jgi:hypothetical protein
MPAGPAPIMIALSSFAYSDMAGVEYYVRETMSLMANTKMFCMKVKYCAKKKNRHYAEKK